MLETSRMQNIYMHIWQDASDFLYLQSGRFTGRSILSSEYPPFLSGYSRKNRLANIHQLTRTVHPNPSGFQYPVSSGIFNLKHFFVCKKKT